VTHRRGRTRKFAFSRVPCPMPFLRELVMEMASSYFFGWTPLCIWDDGVRKGLAWRVRLRLGLASFMGLSVYLKLARFYFFSIVVS